MTDRVKLTDVTPHLTHVIYKHGEKIHADCPYCGKGVKGYTGHFGLFPINGGDSGDYAFKCFSCGETGNLYMLAKHLGTLPPKEERERQYQARREIDLRNKPASRFDEKLIAQYCAAPDRLEQWWGYKPLALETISKYRLGVGKLPNQKTRRLTVPIFEGGKLVGVRGRKLPGAPAHLDSWITAGGSKTTLYLMDSIRKGGILWIVENMIDSHIIRERFPEWDAAAPTAGAQTWLDEWSAAIAAAAPDLVIVAYDNDLPGCCNPKLIPQLQAEWREKHKDKPHLKPPQSGVPKVLTSLAKYRVPAVPFEWRDGLPPKADIGWLAMQGGLNV